MARHSELSVRQPELSARHSERSEESIDVSGDALNMTQKKVILNECEESLRHFADAQHDNHLSLPDLIRQSISLEFSKAPYKGFKLHPFAQEWNLEDDFTFALADAVFDFADKNHLRVLIHCGIDESCFPEKFERFIKKSPDATVQLAHSKPAEKIIRMLEKYQNCLCDSAFASEEDLEKIRNAGFAERILYGSDFPVNNVPVNC